MFNLPTAADDPVPNPPVVGTMVFLDNIERLKLDPERIMSVHSLNPDRLTTWPISGPRWEGNSMLTSPFARRLLRSSLASAVESFAGAAGPRPADGGGRKPKPPLAGVARARQGVRQVARGQLDGRVRRRPKCRSICLRATQKIEAGVILWCICCTATPEPTWATSVRRDGNCIGIAERVYGSGAAREMILVMPNAMNAYGGSMYSNSVTQATGRATSRTISSPTWTAHYRTLATRESRGLAGHSMGGYGTMRIGMKRPDVFARDLRAQLVLSE